MLNRKENPETVVVSGFLDVRKRNRLSLGVIGHPF
jgi:hypothetical protein